MAPAVLASQKESSCGPMGKNPYSSFHLVANPNPNPKKKPKQFHQAAVNGVGGGRFSDNKNNYHNIESPAVTQTSSDDACSFNQTTTNKNGSCYGGYLNFNVANYSNTELHELRNRLSSELNQIRDLRDRIESGQFSFDENPRSQGKSKNFIGNKNPGAAVSAVPAVPRKLPYCYSNNNVGIQPANCERMLKECGKIVAKLVKHKFGYVFKAPVDAVAFGLHDYHRIVKRPMDLGTVKSNLAKGLYRTPMEFASDIRLTFNNALLYNPKSDPVNGMAEQLLSKFEELFAPIQEKLGSPVEREMKDRQCWTVDELQHRGSDELQRSSWNNSTNQVMFSPDRGNNKDSPVFIASNPHGMIQQPPLLQEMLPPSPVKVPTVPLVMELKPGKGGALKLPKPKAKDKNKRDMCMDEKQKLGIGLQSLPQEKMPQLVHIIKKRNTHLAQDVDEIELDIETLDTETLWELDRFVTNWKKLASRNKRQVLMSTQLVAAVAPASLVADATTGSMGGKNDDDLGKKLKDNDDEDVDIDDDMPAASFPPVEIERDEGGGSFTGVQDNDQHFEGAHVQDCGHESSSSSSSGSSGTDSSSSSDSDSGSSSSGSDSDADVAQS